MNIKSANTSSAKKKPSISSSRPQLWLRIVSWVAVAVWAVFIFFMSAHTSQDFSSGTDFVAVVKRFLDGWGKSVFGPQSDLISVMGHFCEYFVFGALLCNAFRFYLPLRKAFLCALLCASAYGVTDEIHQYFVPGRFCDPLDWFTDTLGAAVGAGFFVLMCHIRQGRVK